MRSDKAKSVDMNFFLQYNGGNREFYRIVPHKPPPSGGRWHGEAVTEGVRLEDTPSGASRQLPLKGGAKCVFKEAA